MINVVGSTPQPAAPLPPDLPSELPTDPTQAVSPAAQAAPTVPSPTGAPPTPPSLGGSSPTPSLGGQPPKKKPGFSVKNIIAGVALFLLVIGGGAALYLIRQNQDVRQQASGCSATEILQGRCNPPNPATKNAQGAASADRALQQSLAEKKRQQEEAAKKAEKNAQGAASADRALQQSLAEKKRQQEEAAKKAEKNAQEAASADKLVTTAANRRALANGQPCTTNGQCSSGSCQGDPTKKVCTSVGGGGGGTTTTATTTTGGNNGGNDDDDDDTGNVLNPPVSPPVSPPPVDDGDDDGDTGDQIADSGSGGSSTTTTTTSTGDSQPTLPSTLPQTGPEDWLKYLQIGLGVLGAGALLLLFL